MLDFFLLSSWCVTGGDFSPARRRKLSVNEKLLREEEEFGVLGTRFLKEEESDVEPLGRSGVACVGLDNSVSRSFSTSKKCLFINLLALDTHSEISTKLRTEWITPDILAIQGTHFPSFKDERRTRQKKLEEKSLKRAVRAYACHVSLRQPSDGDECRLANRLS